MFVKKPWKWTMDCWEVTGTWVNTKSAVVSPARKKVVKEDSPRPRRKARKEAPAEASEEAAAEASEEAAAEASEEGLGRALRRSSICQKGWKLWRRRVKVSMGRMREGRAWRRLKVQMCPQMCPQLYSQMLVPRKIKLHNRALFYWTKINPLFQIYRRRMLDI
uniref:Uncharacterized protein n=1 Tax=Brassica oleracea var. oleracea TaxID=109376 RepID=A0A0D3E700_BRAOL